MKGKILIVIGAIIVICVGLWIGGLIPFELAEEKIRTCPSDGESYTELKTVNATTPKAFDACEINRIIYFQDNIATAVLTTTATDSIYVWEASIDNPSNGSHEFKFEFYGFPLGDINNDGIINGEDEDVLNISYESKLGDSNWNPEADLDGNGKVDWIDLGILGANFEKSVSTSLLTVINGTFTITPASTEEMRRPIPIVLQFGLLALGFIFIGVGCYLERKED